MRLRAAAESVDSGYSGYDSSHRTSDSIDTTEYDRKFRPSESFDMGPARVFRTSNAGDTDPSGARPFRPSDSFDRGAGGARPCEVFASGYESASSARGSESEYEYEYDSVGDADDGESRLHPAGLTQLEKAQIISSVVNAYVGEAELDSADKVCDTEDAPAPAAASRHSLVLLKRQSRIITMDYPGKDRQAYALLVCVCIL